MPVIRDERKYSGIAPVGVVRMNTGGAEKYSRIADATQQLTKIAITESARYAEKSAIEKAQALDVSKITTIDPKTGKPEALTAIANLGFIGATGAAAYERVVQERFQQSIENEIKLKAGEIALKYQNDPYSAEKYEEQMVSYLQAMAKTSEVGNKPTAYTNFIINSGTQYITATKLNMMQERIRIERAKTAQSVIDNIETRNDLIRQKALAGEDVGPLIDATVASAEDAENSRLIKAGSSRATREQAGIIYAEAYITSAMDGLDTYAATNIADAIQSGDPSDLSAEERDIYDNATKYMYRTVKGADGKDVNLLNYNGLASVAKAARAKVQEIANDFQRNAIFEQDYNQAFINESIGLAFDLPRKAFNSGLPFGEASQTIVEKHTNAQNLLRNKYLDPRSSMSQGDYNSASTTIRQNLHQGAIIEAYNAAAAAGISPEETRNAMMSAYNTKDTSLLRGATKAAMDVVVQTAVKGVDDPKIDEFIQDLFQTDNRNNAQFRAEQATNTLNEFNSVLNQLGTAGGQDAEGLLSRALELSNSEYLSAVQRSSLEISAKDAFASTIIRSELKRGVENPDGTFSPMSSAVLNAASNYALNGVDSGNLPENLKGAINNILKDGLSSRESLSATLNQRAVRMSNVEANNRVTQERKSIVDSLAAGSNIEPTAKNKQAIEDIVLRNAQSDNFFESNEMFNPQSPAAQILMQSVVSGVLPETLDNSLTNLANGVPPRTEEAAKNLLTFYSQMSNQPRGNSIVNALRANNALSADTVAKLEAISRIHLATAVPIAEITTKLAEDALDENLATVRSKQFAKAVESKSPQLTTKEFVAKAVPDAELNVQALNELVPLADYMFGTFGAGPTANMLNEYYNKVYSDTEGYIIDAASRSGSQSRNALQNVIPNDEVREFFITKVNTELGPTSFKISNSDNVENRAFLMPMYQANGGMTFMAVRKDGMSLVPIINEEMGGMPYAFSTSEEDVLAYARSKAITSVMGDMTIEQIQELRSERAGEQTLLPAAPRSFYSSGGFKIGNF